MKVSLFILAAAALGLAGCSVGPDYRRPAPLPAQALPVAFNAPTNAPEWKMAEPAADRSRGGWWQLFGHAELDRLEALAATNNQSVAAAAAQLGQARALVKTARADFFPQFSAQPGVTRQRTSVNAPTKGQPAGQAYTYNNFVAPLDMNWELDLWGRVRRESEGAQSRFVAAADELEAVRLTVQAEVAADYFMLCALADERAMVTNTIAAYQRSLELTQNRRRGGVASDLDVAQAETQLRAAEAQLPGIELQAESVRHALAVLCGQPASDFAVTLQTLAHAAVPSLPAGLPSELLERRPDVAAAERQMAAANADVGVAKSAFYPRVFLTGAAGFQSVGASSLFDWPSRMWALGPSVNFPLFTGGRNRAGLAAAKAAYDATVAGYRESVLTAFQEVEDQLSAQRLLAAQARAQAAALAAAQHTLAVATNRYRAGLTTYLEVASAQGTALAYERSLVQLTGQRLAAEVNLIKALGGGWQAGK